QVQFLAAGALHLPADRQRVGCLHRLSAEWTDTSEGHGELSVETSGKSVPEAAPGQCLRTASPGEALPDSNIGEDAARGGHAPCQCKAAGAESKSELAAVVGTGWPGRAVGAEPGIATKSRGSGDGSEIGGNNASVAVSPNGAAVNSQGCKPLGQAPPHA